MRVGSITTKRFLKSSLLLAMDFLVACFMRQKLCGKENMQGRSSSISVLVKVPGWRHRRNLRPMPTDAPPGGW